MSKKDDWKKADTDPSGHGHDADAGLSLTRRVLLKAAGMGGLAALGGTSLLSIPAAGAATPSRGGNLDIVHTPINILNPAIQSGIATMIPGAQLFAGLVEFDANWNAHPYLATHWETSSDALSHTFHLRKGATFHDGKEITSADVAFSLHIVKNNHPFGPAMFSSVDRVDTPDKYTAVFRLTKPLPALLVSTSSVLLPIIPKHVYDKGNIRTNPANTKPVGSGPFRLKSYKPGNYLILERFKDFIRDGRPYLDQLTFHIMKDPSTMTLGMQRGSLEYMPYAPVPLNDVMRLGKTKDLSVTYKGYDAIGPINWLAFNLRKKPLSDKAVRHAIAYAIDRDFIVNALFQGKAQKATGPIVPSSPYYSADVDLYKVDIDKANTLLDDAGYKKNGASRFSLTLDTYPSMGEQGQLPAQYMKSQLRKVGIDIQLRQAPDFPTWARRVSNWEFELTMDQVFNYPDPTIGVQRTYMCDNRKKGVIWSNTQGYCDHHVDELFSQAAHEPDQAKRKALYAQVQKKLSEDIPVYWLNVIPYATVYNDRVHDLPLTIWGAMGPFDQVWKT